MDELIDDMADADMPVEVRSLAGKLRRWRNQILAWHIARVSNGPTEALNNLIKRMKESLTDATLPSLQDPLPALRWATQLEPLRHHYTPLEPEAPLIRC